MTIITGILIGALLGLVLGLVPGFNIGFVLLFALGIPDAQLACGLIMGIDATSSIVKSLSILSGSRDEELPDKVVAKKNRIDLAWTSVSSFVTGKGLGCFIGAVLLLFMGKEAFAIQNVHKAIACGMSVCIWLHLILESKHKKLAVISTVLVSFLSILVSKLPMQQPMFILVSSLFIGNSLQSLREHHLININSTQPENYIIQSWDGITAGLLSSMLWGLPTNAICKTLEETENTPEIITARGAIADGIASALGLTILLSTGGARSAAASQAAVLNLNFNNWEAVGILGVSALLSIAAYLVFENLIKIFVSLHNNLPYVIHTGVVLLTLVSLVYLSSGWFIVVALTSLLVNKLIRLAEAPKELSLIAIAILPLLNLF